MENESIIEIKNLKKYFKDVKAVDDISFKVKRGELFAFLGLNGAGKSTTINIICNILEKDEGQVFVDGLSIDENMKKIKPLIGVVFQNNVLDVKLNVYDNLRYRAGLYGLNKAQFQESLDELSAALEFKDLLKRTYGKLSGGQMRRIDIARALLHKPKILILDEPTTGLDPKTRALVWRLINEKREKENLTVLLTTHYMEEASEASYVVIMDGGKIVATGTPNDLKNKYAFDFVRLYKFDEKLPEILEKDNLFFTLKEGIIEIEVEDTLKAKELLLKYDNYISDFEVVKGKMDNVFLNVTGKNLKEV